MGSVSPSGRPAFATPKIVTGDTMVCRQYSIPASFGSAWEGLVQMLGWPDMWDVDIDDPGSSVEDTVAAALAFIVPNFTCEGFMIGQILEVAIDTLPTWALACDGATYLKADYPELAAVISAGLIVDSTHFRTPDRANRFGMAGPPIGVQGGENTHVLTTTEMPSHTHTNTGHQHSIPLKATNGALQLVGESNGATANLINSGQTAVTIDHAGGGAAHNNLPQYEGTTFIIVAKPVV